MALTGRKRDRSNPGAGKRDHEGGGLGEHDDGSERRRERKGRQLHSGNGRPEIPRLLKWKLHLDYFAPVLLHPDGVPLSGNDRVRPRESVGVFGKKQCDRDSVQMLPLHKIKR